MLPFGSATAKDQTMSIFPFGFQRCKRSFLVREFCNDLVLQLAVERLELGVRHGTERPLASYTPKPAAAERLTGRCR